MSPEQGDADDLNDLEDDSSLIQRARAGDEGAYGELFARHHRAALNYARAIAGANEAEDLVAEAFAKLLSALRRDLGPETAFRPYLLTSIRRLWANTLRSRSRYDVVEDIAGAADRLHVRSAPISGETWREEAIAEAFRQLPDRWREVLWLGNVDGYSQAEIARRLDIKPNAVAALSFRAREGLRREYLAQHLAATSDPACRAVVPLLPAYVRGTLDRKKLDRVKAHLETCANCTSAVSDLRIISDNLAVALPAALGASWIVGKHVATSAPVPSHPHRQGMSKAFRPVSAAAMAAGAIAIAAAVAWPDAAGPRQMPVAPPPSPTIHIIDLGLAPRPRPTPRPTPPRATRPLPSAPRTPLRTPPARAVIPPQSGQGTTVTGTSAGQSPGPVRATAP